MKNTGELRKVLADTLRQVKSGKIDRKDAQAIVGLSNSMIKSASLELDHLKYIKQEKEIPFLKSE